jgi:hypothetical protein
LAVAAGSGALVLVAMELEKSFGKQGLVES